MPEFAPGEVKSARAPITVKPSGLSCSAELYLVSNGAKVTTSGIKLFTSTGVKQDVSFPITMPGTEGTYPVYLDIFTNGLLISAYKAVEDVVIAAPAPPPPFTFSNESVYRKTCPRATAWDTPVFDCRITNPSDRSVTHRIEIWQHRYSHTYGVWRDPRMITRYAPEPPWDITLGPGQSYNLHFDGYYYDSTDREWRCDPVIPYHYTIYYWLQDELGNKSRKVSVYRP